MIQLSLRYFLCLLGLFIMGNAFAGKSYRGPADTVPSLHSTIGPAKLISRLYELAHSSPAFRYVKPALSQNIAGNVADSLPFFYSRKDSAGRTRYQLSGYFLVIGDSITLSLHDSLVLNYKPWVLSPANQLRWGNAGISASNFILSRDTASISITDALGLASKTINITISNVDLPDILGLFKLDSSRASGLLNMKIFGSGSPDLAYSFTAGGSISAFRFERWPIGNLQLTARMDHQDSINGSLSLLEKGNRVLVNGNYLTAKGLHQLDAIADVQRLEMGLLQRFFPLDINNASGSIAGLVALKGLANAPDWQGSIRFDSVNFNLTRLGGRYLLDQQSLVLDCPAIHFNHFIVRDSLMHPMVINGTVLADANDNLLDLQVRSADFTLINAPKAINNQFYGYATVDADVSVKGPGSKPVVTGNLQLNKRSDLTLVFPEKNTNRDAARSVVRFIPEDSIPHVENDSVLATATGISTLKPKINYQVNLRTDKDAKLTMIMDPTTGDELSIQGEGMLGTAIDSLGHILLSGNYRLDTGYYALNYQFLDKQFSLLPGSTINFTGNPAEAQINIAAEYIANTSAKELLGNEIGSVDPRIARSFKLKVPFRVLLLLKGSMRNPAISFDIRLPEGEGISPDLRKTIETKLVQVRSDRSAVNKQVFALLMLDRFVGEQSSDFFKGNGTDFSDITAESVSSFLSAALDRIASDLFKGINVDLNLKTYKDFINYDRTEKSDLNVEVSTNFLNNRLNVEVGRNFGIESEDASTKASQQKASRFLPDVTLNYKLSTDGRYMFRSYKKSQVELVLDGYVVESGLAFIITLDYDKLQEMFMGKKEKSPK